MPALGFGRIPVTEIGMVVEEGRLPAKAVVGELITIRATVFREGHDAVNASVVLTDPDGVELRVDMTPIEPRGLDPWEASVRLDREGWWSFRIEGWSDPWGTWLHTAHAKIPVSMDLPLVCREGQAVMSRAADGATDVLQASVLRATALMLTPDRTPDDLLAAIDSPGVQAAMDANRPRDLVSPTRDYPLFVDRAKALYSSWYELFPRSVGAIRDDATGVWRSGTFDTCHDRLEEIAAMGFDVVYLPPIHPIGQAFRKGANNTLQASPTDPGSPWAIGAPEGGHDAIHPDLGDFAAFDRFVAKTKSLGMEVALDFALQASPDHPWVQSHPEWFTTRLDGTIAYAENPPKKYQDIYPLNFDNDPSGIYHEVLRILRLWMSHGVRIFRVDNPHTKPVPFWAWLLSEVRKTDPDVLFLSEAFTRPAMMHSLGKVGFHQSYTYFTWRTEKWELEEYLRELSTETDTFVRPNFFVNTPDINPLYLQDGNPAAFAVRAILATTMSPSWGMYSGFELFEHEPPRPGAEEYANSEKYEYRPRDFTTTPNLTTLITRLNEIRREHPALQQLRQTVIHDADGEQVFVFSKRDGDDTVLVACSLGPRTTVETTLELDFAKLGWPDATSIRVHDELQNLDFTWDDHPFVRLTPENPAHILHVVGP